jgi:hypothetical protein
MVDTVEVQTAGSSTGMLGAVKSKRDDGSMLWEEEEEGVRHGKTEGKNFT